MLVFNIAIYKRHELTRIVLDTYRALQKKYPFKVVIAGSEGDISREIAQGFEYVEVNNFPLTLKNSAMMQYSKQFNPSAVVLMGSDNIINEGLVEHYYRLIDQKERSVCGLKDVYFYDYKDKILTYYDLSSKFGAGRFFPKNVLEAIDYTGWIDPKNKACDSENIKVIAKHGFTEIKTFSLDEIGGFLVDIKGGFSISDRNITLVGQRVELERFYKGRERTIQRLDTLARVEEERRLKALEESPNIPDNIEVIFVSNGNNKEMPNGMEYLVNGTVAKELIRKDLGYVKN